MVQRVRDGDRVAGFVEVHPAQRQSFVQRDAGRGDEQDKEALLLAEVVEQGENLLRIHLENGSSRC
jgi:hypothetical protein